MTKKRSVFSSYFLIIGLALLFTECKDKQGPEYLFRASLLANENHTWYKAFKYFEQILHERSGGRIKLEVYHSEQLAKEIEAIRLIQVGVIDMTITGSMLNNWIEIAAFCELPFLLRDSADMKNLISGPVGKRMEEEMLQKTGLRPVCYFQRAPVTLRPIALSGTLTT